jgi:Zn-finger nucleic acid-binding protein
MQNCQGCGAPLNQNPRCGFCGVLNALDLFSLSKNHLNKPTEVSSRTCPNCKKALNTLNVGDSEEAFYIENCPECQGLFFDEGELPQILNQKSQSIHIDHKMLSQLVENNPTRSTTFSYRPCPICQKLMNRENYGAKSGVIVDHCKGHGLWLEAGELAHLLQWSSAGGQILTELSQAEKIIAAKKAEEAKKQKINEEWDKLRTQEKGTFFDPKPKTLFDNMDLGEELLKNVFRLFK